MHTHYRIVCEDCKEVLHDFVATSTFHFKGMFEWKKERNIHDWLDKHWKCNNVRLIWRDDQLDEIWDGYTQIRLEDDDPPIVWDEEYVKEINTLNNVE